MEEARKLDQLNGIADILDNVAQGRLIKKPANERPNSEASGRNEGQIGTRCKNRPTAISFHDFEVQNRKLLE